MGQRTTIILQHVIKSNGLEQDVVNTRVFYEQWGIGRITPAQMMEILLGIIIERPHIKDFTERVRPQGMIDNTADYDKERLDELDFDRPEEVGRIMMEEFNNNGGVFVRITVDCGEVASIEYAYMKGGEDGGDYLRWCKEEEWFDTFGKYVDYRFYRMYRQVMGYFGAQEHCK